MTPVLDEQFVVVFLEEAGDMLADWERYSMDLLKGVEAPKLDALFRSAHNLKGSARSVGLDEFAKLIHLAEDLINLIRDQPELFRSDVVTVLLSTQQILLEWRQALLENYQCTPPGSVHTGREQLEALKKELVGKKVDKPYGLFGEEDSAKGEHLGVESQRDTYEHKANDVTAVDAQPLYSELEHNEAIQASHKKNNKQKGQTHSQEMIRVPAQKIDVLMQIIGELSTQQATITHCLKNNKMTERVCVNSIQMAGKLTRELQLQTMALRLVDLSKLFLRLERVAMDVSTAQEKKISVVVKGSEVELDKSVIERITDPLVHMVRNAVDHGIEPKGQRPAHKPEVATISIQATQSAGGVQIELADDGRGIDPQRILKKAQERGIALGTDRPSLKQIYELLFRPGFSTADKITDISGRGVGLDVVKRMVDDIDGSIEIESELGQGTKFTVILPTNVSIIDSLVVSTAGQYYVVPIQEVAEVIDLRNFSIESQTPRSKTIALREKAVTICPLEAFIPDTKSKSTRIGQKKNQVVLNDEIGTNRPSPAMIIEVAQKKVGFEFEQVIGQQPILIRKLAGYIAGIPGFSGSTILATGEPAVILSPKIFARQYINEKEVK